MRFAAMVAVLVLATGGCGGGGASSQPAQEPAAKPAQAAAPQQAGRKLESLDVCALVPAKEVAAILGAPLDPSFTENSSKRESSDMASNCWYWIRPEGPSTGEPYIVWVTSPALHAPAENAERISGLGDEAQIRFDEGEKQYRLAVLRRGDVALEVIGRDRERTRRLAELVMSWLGTR